MLKDEIFTDDVTECNCKISHQYSSGRFVLTCWVYNLATFVSNDGFLHLKTNYFFFFSDGDVLRLE